MRINRYASRVLKTVQALVSIMLLGYVFSLIPLNEMSNGLLVISIPLMLTGFLVALFFQYLTSVHWWNKENRVLILPILRLALP